MANTPYSYSNSEIQYIEGTSKMDTISVKPKSKNVTADAKSGNDIITVTKGKKFKSMTIYGGKGNDTITLAKGVGNAIYAFGDFYNVSADGKKVVVDKGKDTIIVNAGSKHFIFGGGGNDKITLNKGAGNSITVYGDSTWDEVISKGAVIDYKVVLNSGKDIITVNSGSNHIISAGGNNDTININAGTGHSVDGGDGNDTIKLNKKSKSFKGAGNSETVTGGSGKDTITASSGSMHHIYGGNGNDTINVNAGAKHDIEGGSGNDTIKLNKGTGKAVTVNGDEGKDTITVTAGSAHKIYGGDGNDTIKINKGAGDGLTIRGDGLYDYSYYGEGNDTITVNAGNKHKIYGGLGSDTITIKGGSGHTVKLSSGHEMINVSARNVTISETSETTTEAITVNWSDTIGVLRINTVEDNGENIMDTLSIKGLKAGAVDFSKSATSDTLILRSGNSRIEINGWASNQAFGTNGILFDGTRLGYEEVSKKAGF